MIRLQSITRKVLNKTVKQVLKFWIVLFLSQQFLGVEVFVRCLMILHWSKTFSYPS